MQILEMPNPEIQSESRLINLDADPVCPWLWSVSRHVPGGVIQFDPTKTSFYTSRKQQRGDLSGSVLMDDPALADSPNAVLLDFLLEHPELIPAKWKRRKDGALRNIFFWGTHYQSEGGSVAIRCLVWGEEGWRWSYHWINWKWRSNYQALILKR